MKNQNTERLLSSCDKDLTLIKNIITKLAPGDITIDYFTRFAIIHTHGTLEIAIKTLIMDIIKPACKTQQVQFFVHKTFFKKALPIDDIVLEKTLNIFSFEWGNNFRSTFDSRGDKNKIQSASKSLSTIRNSCAHGLPVTTSFDDVCSYYA